MSIIDTFKKRMRRQRGEVFDVYQYDEVPNKLRVQIIQIMMDSLGDGDAYNDHYGQADNIQNAYSIVVNALRRELGVFKLPPTPHYEENMLKEIADYILNEEDTEELLTAIELVCRAIEKISNEPSYRRLQNAESISKEAINEINTRFQEHGLGYEYAGEIIRIDNKVIHAEAVKPALTLLHQSGFSVAQSEFMGAYEDYRKEKYEDALTDALKSLESTLKSIFDKRGWSYDADRDTFSKLLQIALDNGLIPAFWQSQFSALRTTLEAGVPTARNRLGGHGAGTTPRKIPRHIVAYTLHMTASAIVFLVESDNDL